MVGGLPRGNSPGSEHRAVGRKRGSPLLAPRESTPRAVEIPLSACGHAQMGARSSMRAQGQVVGAGRCRRHVHQGAHLSRQALTSVTKRKVVLDFDDRHLLNHLERVATLAVRQGGVDGLRKREGGRGQALEGDELASTGHQSSASQST